MTMLYRALVIRNRVVFKSIALISWSEFQRAVTAMYYTDLKAAQDACQAYSTVPLDWVETVGWSAFIATDMEFYIETLGEVDSKILPPMPDDFHERSGLND